MSKTRSGTNNGNQICILYIAIAHETSVGTVAFSNVGRVKCQADLKY